MEWRSGGAGRGPDPRLLRAHSQVFSRLGWALFAHTAVMLAVQVAMAAAAGLAAPSLLRDPVFQWALAAFSVYGAGFPTFRKMEFTYHADNPVRYIVCNADEGEPGTNKDRILLSCDPCAIFEGMAIAARAVDAHVGFIYLRAEYSYLMPTLEKARCVIAVAGMEGALPSVVGGLVSCPVIAVPTSVGYGANLGGLAALLAMLNSCASGVSVVNIDNGFGAGFLASRINQMQGVDEA